MMCRARSVRALASRVHPPFWESHSSWMAVRRCLVTEPVSSSVVMVFSGHDGHCTGEPQQCGHLHAAVGPGEGELAQLLDYVAGMTHGGTTHSAPRTTPTAIHLRVRAPASQAGGTAPSAPTYAPFAPLRRGCPGAAGRRARSCGCPVCRSRFSSAPGGAGLLGGAIATGRCVCVAQCGGWPLRSGGGAADREGDDSTAGR